MRLSAGHPRDVQAVEALARVLEAEALRDDVLGAQAVQRIAHGPRREIRFVDDLLLREQAARLEHLVNELRRRREVLDLRGRVQWRYDYRSDAIRGKNDPSWYVSPHLDALNNS